MIKSKLINIFLPCLITFFCISILFCGCEKPNTEENTENEKVPTITTFQDMLEFAPKTAYDNINSTLGNFDETQNSSEIYWSITPSKTDNTKVTSILGLYYSQKNNIVTIHTIESTAEILIADILYHKEKMLLSMTESSISFEPTESNKKITDKVIELNKIDTTNILFSKTVIDSNASNPEQNLTNFATAIITKQGIRYVYFDLTTSQTQEDYVSQMNDKTVFQNVSTTCSTLLDRNAKDKKFTKK